MRAGWLWWIQGLRATHPLRKASSTEWVKADEVDVVVAGDGVKRMRQSNAGTLLMEPEAKGAQTILPLRSLVSDLVWTRKNVFYWRQTERNWTKACRLQRKR